MGPFESAFVEGRRILDAAFIAHELVDSQLKAKKKGVTCKLDMEMAYDHVSWDCVLFVLKKMGLGSGGGATG